MSLRLIDFHAGVGFHMFLLHGENLNVKFIFNGRYHGFHRLPSFGAQALVAIAHYQFAHGLGTDVKQGVRLFKNSFHVATQRITVGGSINKEFVSIKYLMLIVRI